MNKIEKIMQKQALNKLKKIVLKELKNPYYENVSNVKTVVDINNELVKESNGYYYHTENIFYWRNGWISFNNFDFTTPSLRMIKK